MNFAPRSGTQTLHVELQRMVESLADCICATEEPQTLLTTLLTTLVAQLHREVQITHRLANGHLSHRQATSV